MRVSIITGGGSGIGAAVARRLAKRDESLMLHGQGADAAGLERLKAVAADCQRAGADVAWHTGDLAQAGTAFELVGATRKAFGSIDAIVHAAGYADRRSFTQLPRASLERSFAVMATAFHELAAAALPDLTRGPQGRVVAISSFAATGSRLRRPIRDRRRPRPRSRCWSAVWRSSLQARAPRPMS
ncbi:SDR family oxidoreductase [Bradyrhizobium sp.]|uniref:SDR family NAD(P)-dependent oxidoreductase n=1 Tax=Bradyrhizobium sp. TaxID=376 RepID=UPI003418E8DB